MFPTALGDERGMGRLHVVGGAPPQPWVTRVKAGASASGVAVPIATLDEVVSTLPELSIDLLKIDAEGSEVAILRGGERTLDHGSRIVVEDHPRGSLASVKEILARKGFTQEMIVDYYPSRSLSGRMKWGYYTRDTRPH